jgi:hypothetical protein
MSTLQYATQVSSEGYITLPPEFHGREVVVLTVKEQDKSGKKHGADQPFDDSWRPDPGAVRKLIESRTFTVEITDEEIEQLKRERRMRRMK